MQVGTCYFSAQNSPCFYNPQIKVSPLTWHTQWCDHSFFFFFSSRLFQRTLFSLTSMTIQMMFPLSNSFGLYYFKLHLLRNPPLTAQLSPPSWSLPWFLPKANLSFPSSSIFYAPLLYVPHVVALDGLLVFSIVAASGVTATAVTPEAARHQQPSGTRGKGLVLLVFALPEYTQILEYSNSSTMVCCNEMRSFILFQYYSK